MSIDKTILQKTSVNILGTPYIVETHKVSEDKTLEGNRWAGYCGEESKMIVVADMSEEKYFRDMDEEERQAYRNKTLRHEVVHAFLNESGLSECASATSESWAKHEEMVDWFAIQSPKIFRVFEELAIL